MGSDTMSSSSVSVAQELAVRSFEVQSAGTDHREAANLRERWVFTFANFKEGHPTCDWRLFVSTFVQEQLGYCKHGVPLEYAQCADI